MQNTNNQRAYNMILTERNFGNQTHCYALLGFEISSQSWNLLGGKRDPSDKTRGVTAARELFEESSMIIDKRSDITYWSNLPAYEWGAHKVFVHDPKNLNYSIAQLDQAAKKVFANNNLAHCYKEMSRYQLIKLTDLMDLTRAQTNKGQPIFYQHPQENNPMKIDGWLLHTLKNADTKSLNQYKY